ncbi:DUF6254 family protein [Paenibacillus massiliensis]|uniref:DUF6254 family protein n=1 Tax=Paenibacillus TaxID=44249 RepID=UPI000381E127
MSSSKSRRENRWKQQKEAIHPHGKIKSLHELSEEFGHTKPDHTPSSLNPRDRDEY